MTAVMLLQQSISNRQLILKFHYTGGIRQPALLAVLVVADAEAAHRFFIDLLCFFVALWAELSEGTADEEDDDTGRESRYWQNLVSLHDLRKNKSPCPNFTVPSLHCFGQGPSGRLWHLGLIHDLSQTFTVYMWVFTWHILKFSL